MPIIAINCKCGKTASVWVPDIDLKEEEDNGAFFGTCDECDQRMIVVVGAYEDGE